MDDFEKKRTSNKNAKKRISSFVHFKFSLVKKKSIDQLLFLLIYDIRMERSIEMSIKSIVTLLSAVYCGLTTRACH